MREVYLYFEEKIVRKGRNKLYHGLIISDYPTKQTVVMPEVVENEISDSDNYLAEQYCSHTFNLLGSGPKKVCRKQSIDTELLQTVSSFNVAEINAIIHRLNQEYEFIDWQEDFKNDHHFDVLQKSDSIKNGESNGFDVKLPWELARCQHLPFLARLYKSTGERKYKNEIICEILDFIAYNPVCYGVNWKCTMDVAIRVSNWIMALDLLQEYIDKETEEAISKSIYQHCIFIRYHLEDQRDYRANHYLSDIVGLLYSSTYFKTEGKIKKIQTFAIKQLFASIDEQFYKDGGNFESSLPYHRLSLELVIYGLWRLLFLSDSNTLCGQYAERIKEHVAEITKLGRAFGMMLDAIKPDGNIYQLGDNDSGHLFKFFHYGEMLSTEQFLDKYTISTTDSSWDENELNCKEIQDTINAVLGTEQSNLFFDGLIGPAFKKYKIEQLLLNAYQETRNNESVTSPGTDRSEKTYEHKTEIKFPIRVNLSNMRRFYYPDFGFVGLKNDFFYLGVSITDVGQHGRGGHSHNDKLSFDLYADGTAYQSDPGTYVYTESRKWRNRFRSSLAHNSPYFGEEQNPIGENCFELRQQTECKLIELTDRVIHVSCKYGDVYVERRFELSETQIVVTDCSNREFVTRPIFEYFSNGYGKKIKHKENKSND